MERVKEKEKGNKNKLYYETKRYGEGTVYTTHCQRKYIENCFEKTHKEQKKTERKRAQRQKIKGNEFVYSSFDFEINGPFKKQNAEMHKAVFQLKQALPKSPQKRTAVLASVLQTKSPTIKKLQQMNIVVSEESRLEYELGISILNNLSQDLKSTKKRNDDCSSTVQIITTSSSG